MTDEHPGALSFLDAVADRLEGTGVYKDVLSALDFAGPKRPLRLPSAIVTPMRDQGGESRGGGVRRVESVVAVTTVIAAPNDPGGGRARDPLAALLRAGRTALVGWRPEEGTDEFSFLRGALAEIGDGRAWWEDLYTTARWL